MYYNIIVNKKYIKKERWKVIDMLYDITFTDKATKEKVEIKNAISCSSHCDMRVEIIKEDFSLLKARHIGDLNVKRHK